MEYHNKNPKTVCLHYDTWRKVHILKFKRGFLGLSEAVEYLLRLDMENKNGKV